MPSLCQGPALRQNIQRPATSNVVLYSRGPPSPLARSSKAISYFNHLMSLASQRRRRIKFGRYQFYEKGAPVDPNYIRSPSGQ